MMQENDGVIFMMQEYGLPRSLLDDINSEHWSVKVINAWSIFLEQSKVSSLFANKIAFTPYCRLLIAMLAAKVAVEDLNDQRLSPSAEVDILWRELLLYPAVYIKVCEALGAKDVIDYSPEVAICSEAIKNQRRRACEAEIEFLGIDTFLTSDEDKEN
jgi:hypothetical protein